MAAPDLTSQAAAELYAADPEEFVSRRKELVAAARAAGDKAAAKAIGGLAKPSRSAWMVNKLVLADPGVAALLADLGARLRAGEATLDGTAIRELSAERRRLVDGLVRRALATAPQGAAPAAVREDIAATFNAALADPEVEAQLATGALTRPARWSGFGPGIGTATLAAPGPPRPARTEPTRTKPTRRAEAEPGPAGRDATDPSDAERAELERERHELERQQEELERQQRELERRRSVAVAQRTLTAARKSADAAASRLQRAERAVQVLHQQLAAATEQLSQAQAQAEAADQALADAEAALAGLENAS